jgi:hypothetical protein
MKLLVKPTEVVEGSVERRGETEAIAATGTDGLLKMAEEAPRARQGQGHGA